MNGNVKTIFFDAGHTLIHAHPSLGEIYTNVTKSFGIHVPPDRFAAEFAATFKEFVANIPSNDIVGTDEQDYRMWYDITKRIYDETPELHALDYRRWFDLLYDTFGHATVWRMYPETESILAELRQRGLRLGIISNWDTRLKTIVRELGLHKLIDGLFISSEVGYRKPDKRIFDRAIEATAARPQETIHVGDTYEEDVVGALGAGIAPIFIDRRNTGAPKKNGVRTIETLSELLDLV